MDTPEEKTIPVKTFLYNIGDLLYTEDKKIMALIRERQIGKPNNEYKLQFLRMPTGVNVLHAWKSEWWAENAIQARVISRSWFIQRCGTNDIKVSAT